MNEWKQSLLYWIDAEGTSVTAWCTRECSVKPLPVLPVKISFFIDFFIQPFNLPTIGEWVCAK